LNNIIDKLIASFRQLKRSKKETKILLITGVILFIEFYTTQFAFVQIPANITIPSTSSANLSNEPISWEEKANGWYLNSFPRQGNN